MKYIDAEKLIARIKELNLVTKTYEEQVAFNNALAMVVEIIDSLKQEQVEVLKEQAKRYCCDTWGIIPDALEEVEGFIDSLQQEPQEEICSKCIHHGKDDDCYYPYGGMRRRINEDGVCECTGFYEKEQEQPDKETILRICKLHKVWSIMAPWENVEDFVMTNWNAKNIV